MQSQRQKGQSLVEFALGSIILLMMLAATVDIGRAFYTWIVVHNMAGEGAEYLAYNPTNDCTLNCSSFDDTYQGRARNVASRMTGGALDQAKINTVTLESPISAANRCPTVPFTVTVNYKMDDLFLPGILGVPYLNIGASEQSHFYTSIGACPTPTPLP
jgi:Flp pilus assembly protein TadG